jgi:hypothetical protein
VATQVAFQNWVEKNGETPARRAKDNPKIPIDEATMLRRIMVDISEGEEEQAKEPSVENQADFIGFNSDDEQDFLRTFDPMLINQ